MIILDDTASTNDAVRDHARRQAAHGGEGPLWLMARRQTAGRGRLGRRWAGLDGNLFLSSWRRLDARPEHAAQLSFAGALAVAALADRVVGPENLAFKWPNDVLLHGAKLSGVLLETAHGSADGLELIVGIGVNVAAAPADVGQPATCLAEHAAGRRVPSAEEAARIVSQDFDRWAEAWRSRGFDALREPWLARAHGLGAPLSLVAGGRATKGVFEDVDRQGRLVLRTDAGRMRFAGGEVSMSAARQPQASPKKPMEANHASGH